MPSHVVDIWDYGYVNLAVVLLACNLCWWVTYIAIEQVSDESAKINMHLKLKRGDKEEKFKVEVHKDSQGTFKLNKMELIHSWILKG